MKNKQIVPLTIFLSLFCIGIIGMVILVITGKAKEREAIVNYDANRNGPPYSLTYPDGTPVHPCPPGGGSNLIESVLGSYGSVEEIRNDTLLDPEVREGVVSLYELGWEMIESGELDTTDLYIRH